MSRRWLPLKQSVGTIFNIESKAMESLHSLAIPRIVGLHSREITTSICKHSGSGFVEVVLTKFLIELPANYNTTTCLPIRGVLRDRTTGDVFVSILAVDEVVPTVPIIVSCIIKNETCLFLIDVTTLGSLRGTNKGVFNVSEKLMLPVLTASVFVVTPSRGTNALAFNNITIVFYKTEVNKLV